MDSQALNMIYTALRDLVTLLSLILSPVTTFALALWYISQFSKHNRAAFSAPLIFLILCPLMEYSHWNPYISSGFQVQHQCLRDILLDNADQVGALSNIFPQQLIHLFAYCKFLLNCL